VGAVVLPASPLLPRIWVFLPPTALTGAVDGSDAAGRAGNDATVGTAGAVAAVIVMSATDGVRLVPIGGSAFPVLVGTDAVPLLGAAGTAGKTPVGGLADGAASAAGLLAGAFAAACRADGPVSAGGDAALGDVAGVAAVGLLALAAAVGAPALVFGTSIDGAVGRSEGGGVVVDAIGALPGPADKTWPIPAVDPISRERKVPPPDAAVFSTPQPVGKGAGPVERSAPAK
jgi:hypothetical protein